MPWVRDSYGNIYWMGDNSTTGYNYWVTSTNSTCMTNTTNAWYIYYTGIYPSAPTSAYPTWTRNDYAAVDAAIAAQQERTVNSHSEEAKQKALEFLLTHLTKEQRETFETNKWFIVEGSKTKRKYRINYKENLVANIDLLSVYNDNKRSGRLCGHCGLSKVPLGDQLLAQKLMLECDEDAFLRIANRHAA